MTQLSKNWIFLRGLSREKAHWGGFKDLFEREMNATVHAIDFPGTGEFFQEQSPSTIAEISDHLVMHSSHIQEQSWILAHSMGCLVALEWMKREPHRFLGAVFINTSIKNFSSVWHRLRWFGMWNFLKIGLNANNPEKREALKFLLSSNNPEKKDEAISLWTEIQKQRPVTIRTIWNQLRAAGFYKASKPRYPVLILNSLGDHLVNPDCSAKVASAWGCAIQTHLWAGHEIMLDDPDWVITKIQDWLETPTSS